MRRIWTMAVCALVVITAASLAACGKSSSSGNSGVGALSAEAKSAATGDIPDNQVFLVFRDRPARYSMKYPEGWAQSGSGRNVTFRDKNNIVHVVVASGSKPSPASVATGLARERGHTPSLRAGTAKPIALPAGRAIKVTYTTLSAPNPVTGKRLKLTVDRYELSKSGTLATIDLGTPVGVDNVDAYRLMAQSFRWQ